MTFYNIEGRNDSGWIEQIVTVEYAWQALYAIDSLSHLAPTMELSLRVSPMNGATIVLRVKGERWRFCGATSRQTEWMHADPFTAIKPARGESRSA